MSAGTVVSVTRACVEFDGEHVLENVDLSIEEGEFIALLGPNGSGKTTLIRAILGLQPLDHGKISLFGAPLGRFRDWHRVAIVPQRLPGATSIPVSVWEAVLSGGITPRGRWRPFPRSSRAAAQRALESVGLWSRRHDRLDTLSGGQQRRVLIARALSTSPDLLVMDEPTAGLDTANLQALTALLADLHHAGTTIIVVTHELTGISDLVTRAVVLRNDHHESVKYDGPPPVPADFDDDVHPHHDDPPEAPPTVGLDPS